MADPVTKKEIQELPLHAYDAMRADLQTGDLVFCSGSYFFSHAIQKFTRSVWSHVGMIYKDPTLRRIFILERETMIGVRLAKTIGVHDGGGRSLELINSVMTNNAGQNWAASLVDGGTPGAANSVAATDIAPLIRVSLGQ